MSHTERWMNDFSVAFSCATKERERERARVVFVSSFCITQKLGKCVCVNVAFV